jgi:tetratricopeptide (TPR) repeat protein
MFICRQKLLQSFCVLILSAASITCARAEVNAFGDFLRDFPAAYTLLGPSSGTKNDERRFARVVEDLAKRLKLPPELTLKTIPELAEKLSLDEKAPLLDRARADFVCRQYQQAEKRALQAGDAAHRAKPRRSADISVCLQLAALAALEQEQNDPALKYIQVAQGETDPKKDLQTWAQVHSSLAHIHWRSGRPAEQIKVLRLILSEYLNAEGITHPYTLFYHNELAAALYDDHQDAAAEKELREILRITEMNHGPDDAKTVSVRKNLARILESQDHFDAAESVRRSVIESQKRTIGGDSPVTLRSREQLVRNLFEQRQFTECESESQSLLEVSRRVLGADDLISLSCRLKLAQCQREQGQLAEAEKLLRSLLEDEVKLLGVDDPETLGTAHDLGICLNARHEYADAVKELKPVLDARIRLLPTDHRDTLDTRSQLGIAYQGTGQIVEAELEFRAVMKVLTRMLGPQHPRTVIATQRVTDLLNLPEAKALMISNARAQLAKAINDFGREDSRTLNIQLSLAGAFINQGKHQEAEREFFQVHASLTRSLKEETPQSLLILREIGNCELNQKKWPEAEKMYRQVLRNQRILLQSADPELLQTLYLLGLCYGQQGKMDEARPLLEECLAGTVKVGDISPAFVTQLKSVLDQVIQIQRKPKPEQSDPAPGKPDAPPMAATITAPPGLIPSAPTPVSGTAPIPQAGLPSEALQTINKPLPFKP